MASIPVQDENGFIDHPQAANLPNMAPLDTELPCVMCPQPAIGVHAPVCPGCQGAFSVMRLQSKIRAGQSRGGRNTDGLFVCLDGLGSVADQVLQYCSETCRMKDNKYHRLVCWQWSSQHNLLRPGQEFRRAIIFLAHEEGPRFEWLNFHNFTIQAGGGRYMSVLQGRSVILINSSIPHTKVGHGINISVPGKIFLRSPGAPFNKSVEPLFKAGHGRPWYGDIVFWAIAPLENGVNMPMDMDTRDLRHVIDFFQTCILNSGVTNPERFPGSVMPGLRVPCNGAAHSGYDQMNTSTTIRYMTAESGFQPVTVAVQNFVRQYACELAQTLGLHWVIREDPTSVDWIDDIAQAGAQHVPEEHSKLCLRNHRAQFLVSLALDQGGFTQGGGKGEAPGTIIVLHQRGAPLHPLHLVAFKRFFQLRGTEELHTPEEFSSFWDDFKLKCKRTGYEAEVAAVPSPYDFEFEQSGPILLQVAFPGAN